jgi:polar amino acid transport system ATP-binding protein/sulfate transport system ATP-binding protein
MIQGSTTGDVVLTVSEVSAGRGGRPVLDAVSFEIVDRIREGTTTGQIVSLLGPSGVGKTTLLRIIAGLDRPLHGAVRGAGGQPLDARRVGIVFQDHPLLAHRTVLDNLVVAGRIGGLDARRARGRAEELLARIGLEDRADAWPGQLSGGQHQRVAIAQQLVLPRRVVCLDEPFSGLDPAATEDVAALLVEVANEHELNTIVIVTHDVRAALDVSDTILLLAPGPRGARVAATYDLVAEGLAWGHGRASPARFATLERAIEQRFRAA